MNQKTSTGGPNINLYGSLDLNIYLLQDNELDKLYDLTSSHLGELCSISCTFFIASTLYYVDEKTNDSINSNPMIFEITKLLAVATFVSSVFLIVMLVKNNIKLNKHKRELMEKKKRMGILVFSPEGTMTIQPSPRTTGDLEDPTLLNLASPGSEG